jgi:hypothetical protein
VRFALAVIALLCALAALALAAEPQIEPSALASALAATRVLRHRRRQRSVVGDAAVDALDGHDAAACFRGFQIGHSYHYEWSTSMDATKIALHETKRSEHTRTVLLSLEGIVTPLATDDSGRLTSKLEIVAASVKDSRGWADYSEEDLDNDDIDQDAADEQFTQGMKGEFLYSQACDMSVSQVHHPADESEVVANIKIGMVQAFASHLQHGTPTYTHIEYDQWGAKHVRYEHDASELGDEMVAVTASHMTARDVNYDAQDANDDQSDMTGHMDDGAHRKTHYRDGVIEALTASTETHFPSAADKALAETMPQAPEERELREKGGGLEIHTRGAHKLALRKTVERTVHESEQLHYPSVAVLLEDRVGRRRKRDDAAPMQSRKCQLIVDESAAARDALPTFSAVQQADADDVEQLVRTLHAESGNPAHEVDNSAGLAAWFKLQQLLVRDTDATLELLAPFLQPSAPLTLVQQQDVMSAIGVVGTPACQLALLAVVEDDAHETKTRAAALFALSRVRQYTDATAERLHALIDAADLHSDFGIHLALTYGSIAYTMHRRDNDGGARAQELRQRLVERWSSEQSFHGQFTLALALNNSVRALPTELITSLSANATAGGGARKRQMDGSDLLPRCSGTYMPTMRACSDYVYDKAKPVTPPPSKEYVNDLGVKPFFVTLEFILDWLADVPEDRSRFHFRFFAGGQFSATLLTYKFVIASAYAKAEAKYSADGDAEAERRACVEWTVGLFYSYVGNLHYWGRESGPCKEVPSTCKPYRTPEAEMSYIRFARIVFFKPPPLRFAVGPIPVSITIEGFGEAGLYWDLAMINSAVEGGGMLNGVVQPTGIVALTGELAIDVFIARVGLGCEVTLLRIALPGVAGINFMTRRGCISLGIEVGALGGKVYIFVEIKLLFIKKKWSFTVYQWKGLSWEKELLRKECCEYCPGPCSNGWCNFRTGKCVCRTGWGGFECQIECPAGCANITAINSHVMCTPKTSVEEYTDTCECIYGYLGWNCLDECPGIIAPGVPCSGHGLCNQKGNCECDKNYFGAACDITCPAPPAGEELCGGENGVCVYDGGYEARCVCRRGYAGRRCQAKCAEVRGSPCSFRGDCIAETENSTSAECHCHIGFGDAACSTPDFDGAGRAVQFSGGELGVTFERASRIETQKLSYATMFWFASTALPSGARRAIVVSWRWASVEIDSQGGLYCCSALKAAENCMKSGRAVQPGNWQYVVCAVNSYRIAHDVHMWHYANPSNLNDVWTANYHRNTDWARVPGPLVVGQYFYGVVDNIAILNRQPYDDDIVQLRDHMLAASTPDLLFYAKFDVGAGKVAYDEVYMLSGLLDSQVKWVDSGVRLLTGTVYSNSSEKPVAITYNGTMPRAIMYNLNLDGRLIKSAKLSFAFEVDSVVLCPVTITLAGRELVNDAYTGSGDATVDVPATFLPLLRGGNNEIVWSGKPDCPYVIENAQLSVVSPAVDPIIEFDGREWSHFEVAAPALSTPFTVEAWVLRVEELHSDNGRILEIVPRTFDDRRGDASQYRIFRWHETFNTGERGVLVQYSGGGAPVAFYDLDGASTPVGRWFHYVLTVDSACNHRLFIDGIVVRPLGDNNGCMGGLSCMAREFGGASDTRPFVGYQPKNGAAQCGDGSLVGWGDTASKLRVGPGFYGSLNNVAVWRRALPASNEAAASELRERIFLLQPRSFWASAALAYDFEEGAGLACNNGNVGPGCAIRDVSGNNVGGAMRNGSFRGLMLAIPHDWENCPGVSYFEPQSPCNTNVKFTGGRCYKEDLFDLTHHCDCLPGFFGPGCTTLCPGAALGASCGGHGECFELNGTVCVCDEGYIGDACQHECPGFSAEYNIPQRVCSGAGQCNMTASGSNAECICEPTSNRYGDACQFINGAGPDQIKQEVCVGCNGPHERCLDDVCVCDATYYRVFGSCKSANPAAPRRSVAFGALFAAAIVALSAATF